MVFIPRKVRVVRADADGPGWAPSPQALQDFRAASAWVLLGEPGAGKSAALRREADQTGQLYLSAADLAAAEPPPSAWQGRTLYIDALDEARAEGAASLSARLRNQLRRLGNPPFRLACRAADWYGSSDRELFSSHAPDGRLLVLQLVEFDDEEIVDILRDGDYGVMDPHRFFDQARQRGIEHLLRNPQTLRLIAEAVRGGGEWPDGRDAVYRMACEKLVLEANVRHRDIRRQLHGGASPHVGLQTAGQLCAVLLLSGKHGVATDQDAATADFPLVDGIPELDPRQANQILNSRLFVPEHERRLVPCHRSVAEYLAADWLARALDDRRLPLSRLLNLFLATDGGVVAALRGLYAWLTLRSGHARGRLLNIDPLGVVLYGDAGLLSTGDKRRLLGALRSQAESFPGFRWHLRENLHPFGALADEALMEDFRTALRAPARSEADQSYLDCVVDILRYGDANSPLADELLAVIKHPGLWPRIRHGALEAWLKLSGPEEARKLLDGIAQGEVADDDDELMGRLLAKLYPRYLSVDRLPRYLHAPKEPSYLGSYQFFWNDELPEIVPDDHVPVLLDLLQAKGEVFDNYRVFGAFRPLAIHLLARGLETGGDAASDASVFGWLQVGVGPNDGVLEERGDLLKIRQWLSRPDRYKRILGLCIQASARKADVGNCLAWLNEIQAPDDIGIWHLQQAAAHGDPGVAAMHIAYAVQALIHQQGMQGLSLEGLERWAAQHPHRAQAVAHELACPWEGWRREHGARQSLHRLNREAERRRRTAELLPCMGDIRAGTAAPGIFDHLAHVWLGRFSDIHGATEAERFADYVDCGAQLQQAAAEGFRNFLLQADLPTVAEIVESYGQNQRYVTDLPCLLGMALMWQAAPDRIRELADQRLGCVLAFHLTHPLEREPDWLVWLAQDRPELTAQVMTIYAQGQLKAGKHVAGLSMLLDGRRFIDLVRVLAPTLLRLFPLRARKEQLRYLKDMLYAALRYTPVLLNGLIEDKLALRSMDGSQRVYWYAAALLQDPERYESLLWRHIGTSAVRAELLTDFLAVDGMDSPLRGEVLPADTLGKLIELLAPHAEIARASGRVTPAMRRGYCIAAMIGQLGGLGSLQAFQEIERLLALDTMDALRYALESARNEVQVRLREGEFRFPDIGAVARVLANGPPASAADLAALAMDMLDDIGHEIGHANDDGFKAFWNIDGQTRKPMGRRGENECRDALLTRWRPRLEALGIGVDPEVDHRGDKSADLCLTYRNLYALPIEIKRDDHKALWTALRKQLLGQYADAPKSGGYGIYLVLWFNQIEKVSPANDGGKRPRSPQELQSRLTLQLTDEERRRIFVRVLDVSWLAA